MLQIIRLISATCLLILSMLIWFTPSAATPVVRLAGMALILIIGVPMFFDKRLRETPAQIFASARSGERLSSFHEAVFSLVMMIGTIALIHIAI